MGEAKNRKNEIKNLKMMGVKEKVTNGYRLANPYLRKMAESKGGWIRSNTPYGFHFDLPINSLEEGLNTMTAKLFKMYGDMFSKQCAEFFDKEDWVAD